MADACWLTIFFEQRTIMRIGWVIPLGLLIEWPAVWKMTSFGWAKSLWVTVCMNAVSLFAGIILQFPSIFMPGVAGIIYVFAVAILGSTFIEGFIVNRFRKGAFNRRTFPLLLGVNVASGGITLAAFLVWA